MSIRSRAYLTAAAALVWCCLGANTARAEGPAGSFTTAPVFSDQGFALTAYTGGTAAQLETATAAAGAKGAWVTDATGTPRLMMVSGPPFVVKTFAAAFPSILGVVPVTLLGVPRTTTDQAAAAASGAVFTQSHGALPPPPPDTASHAASGSNVARIVAPKFDLDHYIEDIGIVDGAMDTPHDESYGVGWYFTYDRPGVPGNAVFSAHETWAHMQAPFYGLYRAQPGDELTLRMTSGTEFRYRVITHHRYDIDTMPMAEIITPPARKGSAQWITLITCGGRLVYDDSGYGEYLDRDVIVAERVN